MPTDQQMLGEDFMQREINSGTYVTPLHHGVLHTNLPYGSGYDKQRNETAKEHKEERE